MKLFLMKNNKTPDDMSEHNLRWPDAGSSISPWNEYS